MTARKKATKPLKIIHVVGARPNFMKMAPVYRALQKHKVKQFIVHTGQHYSQNMSDIFFKELRIKEPDINLQIGSGSHAKQVAAIMHAFEDVVLKEKPSLVLVYGDVNSTVAAALVSAKLGVPVGHVEAGLRSFDMTMPEEINRIITDQLASLHFIPSKDAHANLLREGINKKKIHFVGNVMIDTLITFSGSIMKPRPEHIPFETYGVLTLHRPSNVDDPKKLKAVMAELHKAGAKVPLIFPAHPRTKAMLDRMKNFALDKRKIHLIEPLGYTDFLNLVYHAEFVITDSGGLQEETTYLKKHCFTLRNNTERPVTVTEGTNILIGEDFDLLHKKVGEALKKPASERKKAPARWDGKAGERIAKIIVRSVA